MWGTLGGGRLAASRVDLWCGGRARITARRMLMSNVYDEVKAHFDAVDDVVVNAGRGGGELGTRN